MEAESDRLLLRLMTVEDTEDILGIFSDPCVMASFEGTLFDQAQMKGWVRRNLTHQEKYGYGLFSVVLKSEGWLIGDCGFEHMAVDGDPEVELGYDFRSDYWGRGYATEAAIAVRELAWSGIGLSRLISLIRPSNIASLRVSEKIGMRKERKIARGEELYWIYAIAKGDA